MTRDKKIQTCHDFVDEVMNDKNVDAIDQYFSDDYVEHNTIESEPIHGLDEIKRTYDQMLTACPDMTVTIEDAITQGDTVAVRYVSRGTHLAEFMGIPPTENEVEIRGKDWYRFEDGEIVEGWVQIDALGLMQQLEVLPDEPSGPVGMITHFLKQLLP